MKLFVLLLCVAFASAVEHHAMTNLTDPKNESNVVGNVTFTQANEYVVTMTVYVKGLTPGEHGFHIHEKGDVSTSCMDAGGHYNPYNMTHGAPKDEIRHVGDLGNIVADANGVASISMADSLIKLTGEHSIVGLSVVVHADKDDLGKGTYADSKTTGHAGARLACGKITKSGSAPLYVSWSLIVLLCAALNLY